MLPIALYSADKPNRAHASIHQFLSNKGFSFTEDLGESLSSPHILLLDDVALIKELPGLEGYKVRATWEGIWIPYKDGWVCVPNGVGALKSEDGRGYRNASREMNRQLLGIPAIREKNLPVPDTSLWESTNVFEPSQAKGLFSGVDFSKVCIDLETSGLSSSTDKILTLSMTFQNASGIVTAVFPMFHKENPLEEGRMLSRNKMLFDFLNKFQLKFGHNVIFDIMFLKQLWGQQVLSWELADTMALSYALNNRLAMPSLETCTLLYLGVMKFKEESDVAIDNLANTDLLKVMKYNGRDTRATWELYERLNQLCLKQGTLKYAKFHSERLPVLAALTLEGFPLDGQELSRQLISINEQVEVLKEEINNSKEVKEWNSKGGSLFNPASPSQVTKILKLSKKLPEDAASSAKDVLEKVKGKLAKNILDLRSAEKRKATLLDLTTRGSVLHASFFHTTTRTGRISSASPNFQNVPKDAIRNAFVAPKGKHYVAFDFAALEAHIIANVSQDRFLLKSLAEGHDIHGEVAEDLAKAYPPFVKNRTWGGLSKDEKGEYRFLAKNGLVFAAFYLASPPRVASCLDIPLSIIESYMGTFWARYSGVRRWQKEIQNWYERFGELKGHTGRIYKGVMTPNDLANYDIQGCGSDVVVAAMGRAYKKGYTPCLEIHDEVGFFVPEETWEKDSEILGNTMVEHPNTDRTDGLFDWFTGALVVKMKEGHVWGEVKDGPTFRGAGAYEPS